MAEDDQDRGSPAHVDFLDLLQPVSGSLPSVPEEPVPGVTPSLGSAETQHVEPPTAMIQQVQRLVETVAALAVVDVVD